MASKRIAFFAFQTRDLDRALQVASGKVILWGPELTGGGHLPGGLYYWLMAIPLIFDTTWVGPWYVIAFLWSLSQVLVFTFFWRWIGVHAAFVGFMVFFPTWFYTHFLNLSAVPVFVVAEVVALTYAFVSNRSKTRRLAWILCGLATGFALHLHFSAITILIAGMLIQVLAPRLGLSRLPTRDFWLGLAAVIVPLLPFLVFSIASSVGLNLGVPVPGYSGESSDALPALLYLAQGFWNELLTVETLMKLLLLFPIPLMAAVFAVRFDTGLRSIPKRGDRLRSQLLKILTICAVAAFLPASYYLIRPNGLRYIIPFMVTVSGLTALAHFSATRTARRLIIYSSIGFLATVPMVLILWENLFKAEKISALIPVFIALGAVALLSVHRIIRLEVSKFVALAVTGTLLTLQIQLVRSEEGVPRLPLMSVKSMRQMVRTIYARTGWDYETARHRTFFINTQMGISAKYVYQEVVKGFQKQGKIVRRMKSDAPDGYLVTNSLVKDENLGEDESESIEQFKTWVLDQPMQSDLLAGLRDGGIKLGDPEREDRVVVVPYWIINKAKYPVFFNNIGYPYEDFDGNEVFKGLKDPVGAKQLNEKEAIFYWKDCPGHWCTAGFRVYYERDRDKLRIRTRIQGPPLEQVSEWTGPGWTQAWIKPYLKVTCGSRTRLIHLLDSVGINLNTVLKVSGMNQAYNSFLAPIEKLTEVPCPGELRELRAGRVSTLTYTMTGPRPSQPPEAVLKIQR